MQRKRIVIFDLICINLQLYRFWLPVIDNYPEEMAEKLIGIELRGDLQGVPRHFNIMNAVKGIYTWLLIGFAFGE